jgi:hypothetical protein
MDASAPIMTFHRVCPAASWPIKANQSALGTAPSVAFRFCEAFRVASSFGFYILPPPYELIFYWDGGEVRVKHAGEFIAFDDYHPDASFVDLWEMYAPEDLKDSPPAIATNTPMPGVVQIWSGLLIGTAEGWSTLIRPPVNIPSRVDYQVYEGVVETDGEYKPAPLFTNLRIIEANRSIRIKPDWPLFQVQPILRANYQTIKIKEWDGIHPRFHPDDDPRNECGMSKADWNGYREATRPIDQRPGKYNARVRRREKEQ